MNKLRNFLFILSLIATFSVALQAQEKSLKQLTAKQLKWYNSQQWLNGVSVKPDMTVDVAAFVRHYEKYPARWEQVFKFMKEHDLKTLPTGKVVLSEDLFYNVQEYTTKEPGNERMEGHRKYIDLQCVITGKELHGVAKINQAQEVVPYNANSDYAGFESSAKLFHVVSPEFFSIYFPTDIHFPNIQYGEKATVKKIVFKIKVD